MLPVFLLHTVQERQKSQGWDLSKQMQIDFSVSFVKKCPKHLILKF